VARDADPGGSRARPGVERRPGSPIPARKRWGQHFLASAETARRIVDAAGLDDADTVVEVGPGDGALTLPISRVAARLLAIEIDPRRAERLRGDLRDRPHVIVLSGDVLERPFSEWLAEVGFDGPAVLVANLPYNAATKILCRAIEEPGAISRCLATVQREVARRFAAGPDGEAYGYLSVRAAAFAAARILFDLPPSAFRPRPKVVSSVLELTPRRPPLDPARRGRALKLASLGFRSRRKTLANALAAAGRREVWEEALSAMGKSPRARAEELSLDDFLELARRVPQ
jgi:16S rRNA (adenine1518-N6/adenine1519-N6)-dimethyltransferase